MAPAGIRGVLGNVLEGGEFSGSARLRQLLSYLVEETLNGRAGLIKAITIAQDVYSRDDTFDSRTDAVVRTEVGRLRRKLELYYLTEGQNDPIRIDIPKGVYVPAFSHRSAPQTQGEADLAGTPGTTEPSSIAVLPFANLRGDQDQEYFSDGITEDLIAALSKFRWFRVVARNSSFSYKGQPTDVRRIATELDVRYVLEGSVRRAGNHIRLSCQLNDGPGNTTLWSERYDRDLSEILALQDELILAVVGAVEPELAKAEQNRARIKPTGSLDARELYQRGMWHLQQRTKEDLETAIVLLWRANGLDSNFVLPLTGLADAYYFSITLGHSSDVEADRAHVLRAARGAIELEYDSSESHIALGIAYSLNWEHEAAIAEFRTAIGPNPNSARGYFNLASAQLHIVQMEDAIDNYHKAIELSPRDLYMASFMGRLAMAYIFVERDGEAAKWAGRSLRERNAPWPCDVMLTSALGHLGRRDEATEALAGLRKKSPEINEGAIRKWCSLVHPDHMDRIIDGLRKAGLSE